MQRIPILFMALVLLSVAGGAQARPDHAGRSQPDLPPSGFAKAIVLWPDGAPLANGTTPADVPKLYYYPATSAYLATSAGNGSAVIVLPGGGYLHLEMEKEGAVEARWLAAHGIPAFVLQYRLAPKYRYPVPLLDGARAVRYVRSHAGEFGIQPGKVGVWGFSAGGHLAGYLATEQDQREPKSIDPVERVSAHPDFAIFAYARLSLDDSIPRPGTMEEALYGKKPTPEMLDAISIARHVTKDTSPSFIYSTTADQTVNAMNATAYYDAMKRAGVPVEMHLFEQGPHGTGMGQGLKGMPELEVWPVLLEHWMQLHGWMAAGAPEK